jgi:hypothetical protein
MPVRIPSSSRIRPRPAVRSRPRESPWAGRDTGASLRADAIALGLHFINPDGSLGVQLEIAAVPANGLAGGVAPAGDRHANPPFSGCFCQAVRQPMSPSILRPMITASPKPGSSGLDR